MVTVSVVEAGSTSCAVKLAESAATVETIPVAALVALFQAALYAGVLLAAIAPPPRAGAISCSTAAAVLQMEAIDDPAVIPGKGRGDPL